MNRRWFLRSAGVASLGALAGCTVHLPKPGDPEVTWHWQSEGFVGSGFQPTIVVTGEVQNIGPVYIEKLRLEIELVDSTGDVLQGTAVNIEMLEQGERQQYSVKFELSSEQVSRFDTVEIEATYP